MISFSSLAEAETQHVTRQHTPKKRRYSDELLSFTPGLQEYLQDTGPNPCPSAFLYSLLKPNPLSDQHNAENSL